MTHVFMSGEAGDFNLGDQGMALACVNRLRNYFPDLAITAIGADFKTSVLFRIAKLLVPWSHPKAFRHNRLRRALNRLGILRRLDIEQYFETSFNEAFHRSDVFRQTIDEIEKATFVFDMGHGGINDIFGGLFLQYFYWLSRRLNKPLFVSGKSVGPLSDRLLLNAYRIGLNHAHTIILRDKDLSKPFLADKIQLTGAVNLIEAGDDTLDLEALEPNWKVLPSEIGDIIRSGQFFAVQWRPTDYSRKFTTIDYETLASLISSLCARTGLVPVFVPTSWEKNPDILAAVTLEALLPQKVPFRIVSKNIGAQATKWILGKASFGIGLSYHFHVWLLSQGRPSIGIFANPYYRIKIHGAFQAMGYAAKPFDFAELSTLDPMAQSVLGIVGAWTKSDSDKLIANAECLRKEWHHAFANFVQSV